MNWFESTQKNKPQSNSVGPASLIFISGGMNIAWSFSWNTFTTYIMYDALRYCWFIAAMCGAVIGAPLATRLPKKVLFYFSGILVLLGGILFVALPNDYDAAVAARCLDGLASGLIFPMVVAMASEESVKELRGMVASAIEAMSFALGIFLQQMYNSQWTYEMNLDFHASKMHGLISIICAITALAMTFLLVIESPIFYLVRNNEQAAIDCLRRLQRPFTLTPDIYQQLDEHKRYIAENKEMDFAESARAGMPSLLKLCFYRSMVALSFSSITVLAFLLTLPLTTYMDMWPVFGMGLCRFLGAITSVFLMDSLGRKIPMLFGTIVCGAMALAIGVIYDDTYNFINVSKMEASMALLLVYQLFAGVSVTSSSAYLGEAFPLAIKTYFAAIAFAVEMIVQIIIISSHLTLNGFVNYFYVVGSLSIAFFIAGFILFPETKKLSLREAQSKFSKLITR